MQLLVTESYGFLTLTVTETLIKHWTILSSCSKVAPPVKDTHQLDNHHVRHQHSLELKPLFRTNPRELSAINTTWNWNLCSGPTLDYWAPSTQPGIETSVQNQLLTTERHQHSLELKPLFRTNPWAQSAINTIWNWNLCSEPTHDWAPSTQPGIETSVQNQSLSTERHQHNLELKPLFRTNPWLSTINTTWNWNFCSGPTPDYWAPSTQPGIETSVQNQSLSTERHQHSLELKPLFRTNPWAQSAINTTWNWNLCSEPTPEHRAPSTQPGIETSVQNQSLSTERHQHNLELKPLFRTNPWLSTINTTWNWNLCSGPTPDYWAPSTQPGIETSVQNQPLSTEHHQHNLELKPLFRTNPWAQSAINTAWNWNLCSEPIPEHRAPSTQPGIETSVQNQPLSTERHQHNLELKPLFRTNPTDWNILQAFSV